MIGFSNIYISYNYILVNIKIIYKIQINAIIVNINILMGYFIKYFCFFLKYIYLNLISKYINIMKL